MCITSKLFTCRMFFFRNRIINPDIFYIWQVNSYLSLACASSTGFARYSSLLPFAFSFVTIFGMLTRSELCITKRFIVHLLPVKMSKRFGHNTNKLREHNEPNLTRQGEYQFWCVWSLRHANVHMRWDVVFELSTWTPFFSIKTICIRWDLLHLVEYKRSNLFVSNGCNDS